MGSRSAWSVVGVAGGSSYRLRYPDGTVGVLGESERVPAESGVGGEPAVPVGLAGSRPFSLVEGVSGGGHPVVGPFDALPDRLVQQLLGSMILVAEVHPRRL